VPISWRCRDAIDVTQFLLELFSDFRNAESPIARARRSSLGTTPSIAEESAMKTFLFVLAAAASMVGAAPASAQVWFDVGPVAARIGPPPPWGWNRRYVRDYAYVVGDCRVIRERIRDSRGRRIVREREICD
jgi:hypothetical protein